MRKIVVVGGGISGLSAAQRLLAEGHDVTVLEASPRVGGKISTVEFSGVHIDAGPDAFLVRDPEMKELCADLGLGNDLVAPSSGSAKIWVERAMHALPKSQFLGIPLDLEELASLDLISPEGLQIARNDFTKEALERTDDESIGSLIRGRLGDEVMDKLVGPLLGGINAGNPDKISLHAGAPYLATAASFDSSLIRSIQKFLRSSDRDPKAPVFLTHPEGLGKIIDALEEELSGKIILNENISSVVSEKSKWVVEGTERYEADAVILSTPAYVSAGVLSNASKQVSELLSSIEYASMAFVLFAFPSDAVEPFDGSGFLVAKSEGLLMTACSWSSSKWSHLGIDKKTFIRVSAGRVDDERASNLSNDELVSKLLEELSLTVGLQVAPIESKVVRWPKSFPQYNLGHPSKVEEIYRLLQHEAPGMYVAGAAFNGLGLSACIRDGRNNAQKVHEYLREIS